MTPLERLIAELAAEAPPAIPLQPVAASDTDVAIADWLAETARLRQAANERTMAHRRRIDAASQRLFGVTARSLLPTPDAELQHFEARVAAPAAASLQELVPGLPDGVPAPEHSVAGAVADDAIRVFVTAPPAPDAAIVRMHGGAFWMGGGPLLGRVDRFFVDHIASAANAAVVEVDYRLAPEHPYPAPVIDALTVIDAVRAGRIFGDAEAERVIGPLHSVGLLGTSSGANILSLAARLEAFRGNELAALGLLVPSLNLASGPQAAKTDSAAWRKRRALLRCYLGDVDLADTWISPGTLTRIERMPPTFAALAQFDEVAVGGAEFCAAIREGEQQAEAKNYAMTHVVATPDAEAEYIRDFGGFFAASFARAMRTQASGVQAGGVQAGGVQAGGAQADGVPAGGAQTAWPQAAGASSPHTLTSATRVGR